MENTGDISRNQQTEVTINKPTGVIYCSDGVIEEIEQESAPETNTAPSSEDNVDTKTLTWGPWFSHYAWKSGSKVLNAVDYAGESLASFFGITTPKYQIEIDEYERVLAEKKAMDEESAGWVKKEEGGDVPLVLNEPQKEINKTDSLK